MILDESKRLYDRLLKHFTNSIMDNATLSSNPKLSLPQSPCTFPTPSNESDTHRKEESEIYDNGKDEITD
jgi:hypothetical protein